MSGTKIPDTIRFQDCPSNLSGVLPGKNISGCYRSANFSTTRTLSPRTVIGIGTILS